jgi:membrane associated rhomboid family serine protease
VAGRYEFPFQSRQRDGWFKVGSLDVTTTVALVGIAVLSMIVYAVDKVFLGKFVLAGPLVRDGDLWRIFTWPLVNPPDSIVILVILGLVFVWFVGHEIEELIGRKRYTIMMALMTVVPAVLVCLLESTARSTSAYGLYGLGMGLLAIIAFHEPNRPFFFRVPAWVIGLVYAFLTFVQLAGDRLWGTLLLYALVSVTAVVYMRQLGYLGDTLGFIPSFGRSSNRKPAHPPRRGPAPRRAKRAKVSNRVVEGPWAAPATSENPAAAAAAQAELDELLDKISAVGLDALTSDEKRRLNDLSKRLR